MFSSSCRRLAIAVLAPLCLAQPAAASLILTDAVESNGGWVVTGNPNHFFGAVAGLSPTAGATMMHLQNIGGRVATKSFSGLTAQAGTYTVTFDIGRFANAGFSPITSIGMTTGGTLLAATTLDEPEPTAAGTWKTWTLTYQLAAGAAELGQQLGFKLTVDSNGQNRNGAFDNLKIDFVAATPSAPEPGALALTALALVGAAAASRRRVA